MARQGTMLIYEYRCGSRSRREGDKSIVTSNLCPRVPAPQVPVDASVDVSNGT
jgi:hypothetical protein